LVLNTMLLRASRNERRAESTSGTQHHRENAADGDRAMGAANTCAPGFSCAQRAGAGAKERNRPCSADSTEVRDGAQARVRVEDDRERVRGPPANEKYGTAFS